MKNVFKGFELAVVIAVIALSTLSLIGCSDGGGSDGGGGDYIPPEERPVKDRWGSWFDPTSTVTLVYSVADDGVCTITVSGTADERNAWKAFAGYWYTAKAGARYEYTFEARTESGARELQIQYYENNDDEVWLGSPGGSITNTWTTHTVRGQALPKGGERKLQFQCADQTGTFYVRVISITEVKGNSDSGKLTITNFSGSPGLKQNSQLGIFGINGNVWSDDIVLCDDGTVLLFGSGEGNIPIKGNTLTTSVREGISYSIYYLDGIPYFNEFYLIGLFTGNATIEAGNLGLKQIDFNNKWEWIGDHYYVNKVPITFTNGNATINFGTQMEFDWSYDPR